jgi:tetratricopeptide (TPR) repeat protein
MRIWRALSFVVGNHWGRYEEWTRATEQAMYHARQIGETGLLDFPSMLILGPGPADEILQTLEPLLDETLAPGHRLAQAVLLAMLGRFDDAWSIEREVSERLLAISDESGDAAAAEIAAMAGEYETAAKHMRAFCDRLEGMGNVAALSTYASQLGRILCKLSRYDEAEPLARQGRELGDEHDVTTQILWRQTQALVLASRGEHGEAERLAREAVAIIGETDALSLQGDALWDLAEVLWQVGREEEARDTLTQALDRYGRKKNLAMVAQVRRRLEA